MVTYGGSSPVTGTPPRTFFTAPRTRVFPLTGRWLYVRVMDRIARVYRAVGTGSPVRRLLLGSSLMLFLELALIRWLGANVVHLSYFSNFVLLGSFLGIGLGFLVSRKTWSALPWTAPLLALLVVVTLVFPVTIQRQGSDVIYFTAMRVNGPPVWLALPVIFLLVAATLAGPAEVVGRCFGALPPLTA